LKEDSAIARKIIDAVPLYILLFDCRGRIKKANRAIFEGLGFSREEMLAMTMEDFDPDFDIQGVAELMDCLRREEYLTRSGQLTDKKGRVFPVERKLTLIENQDCEYVASISQNISELIREKHQKQLQESALRRARDAAEAANRIKSEFLANMNHEIRTPMNAIIGYAEMLAAADLGEREQRFVKTIRKSGATLISILNNVVELSKLESGSLRIAKIPTRLQSLVDEAVDLFIDQMLVKKIDFYCTIQSELPDFFFLDEVHCRQILVNLFSNAVKFTSRGDITLVVSGVPIAAGFYDLQFRVTDTGGGIAAEEQKHISALLEQDGEAVGQQGGKRIGLTLCARLALMMGGRLILERGSEQGSIFMFSLPAKAVEEGPRREEESVQQQHRQGSKDYQPVLLVVDDMPMISDVIRDYFASDPLEVLVAENSEEGLALARSRLPDLILMDLNLAGVDGREVTKRLREDSKTASIPVVVMTGRMLDEEEYRPFFDYFLAKPFHLDELQRVVDRFIWGAEKNKVQAPLIQTPQAGDQDLTPLLSGWTDELDELLARALASGSLDAAQNLGLRMHEYGEDQGCEQLQSLGLQLEEYAAALDILGVEQLLELLIKHTGESS